MDKMIDKFIGLEIDTYVITELIGTGCVGRVYKAENKDFSDERAIKFVPLDVIEKKEGWEQEIVKVNKLHRQNVVRYHSQKEITISGTRYLCVMWDYISGKSLKDIIDHHQLTIQILVEVVVQSLALFFACKQIQIQHADFHSGNILIQDEDPLDIEQGQRKIWFTDFGYGSFSPSRETLLWTITTDYPGSFRKD